MSDLEKIEQAIVARLMRITGPKPLELHDLIDIALGTNRDMLVILRELRTVARRP